MAVLDAFRYPDREEVGKRLEQVREAFSLEKGEFARSIGIDPSQYSKIIRGCAALRAENAFVVSERWGVPMDFLYRGRLSDLPDRLDTHLRNVRSQRQP